MSNDNVTDKVRQGKSSINFPALFSKILLRQPYNTWEQSGQDLSGNPAFRPKRAQNKGDSPFSLSVLGLVDYTKGKKIKGLHEIAKDLNFDINQFKNESPLSRPSSPNKPQPKKPSRDTKAEAKEEWEASTITIKDVEILQKHFFIQRGLKVPKSLLKKLGLKVWRGFSRNPKTPTKKLLKIIIPLFAPNGDRIPDGFNQIFINQRDYIKYNKGSLGNLSQDSGFIIGDPEASKVDIFEGFEKALTRFVTGKLEKKDTCCLVSFGAGRIGRIHPFLSRFQAKLLYLDDDAYNKEPQNRYTSMKQSLKLGDTVERVMPDLATKLDIDDALKIGRLDEWTKSLRPVSLAECRIAEQWIRYKENKNINWTSQDLKQLRDDLKSVAVKGKLPHREYFLEINKALKETPQARQREIQAEVKPGKVEKPNKKEDSKKIKIEGLIDLIKDELFLFRNREDDPFCRVKSNNKDEIWSLKSESFKNWVSFKYHEETGKIIDDILLRKAVRHFKEQAVFKSNFWEPQNISPPDEGKKTEVDGFMGLALSRLTLFHDQYEVPYARVENNGHYEIRAVDSGKFKKWLANIYYKETGEICEDKILRDVHRTLSAQAIFDEPQYKLHVRCAEFGEYNPTKVGEYRITEVWYDLGDKEWKVVKITAKGWAIVTDPPILFYPQTHVQAQVEPVFSKNPYTAAAKIFKFFNLQNKDDEFLTMIQLISWYMADQAKPISLAHGEGGGSKSTFGRVMKAFVDPCGADLLTLPETVDKIIFHLATNYVLVYDNLSGITNAQSNILCRACTGGGDSKRALFKDSEVVTYEFKRAIAINGINNMAHNEDLLDRMIVNHLDRLEPKKRKGDKEFWAILNNIKGEILGGLFSILASAIALYVESKPEESERMADFTHLGCAIAEAIGMHKGEAAPQGSWSDYFRKTYRGNIMQVNEDFIEDNIFANAIVRWWKDLRERYQDGKQIKTYEGTATQFFIELNNYAEENEIKMDKMNWPQAPNVVTRRINKMRKNLQQAGVKIEYDKRNDARFYIISDSKPKESSDKDEIDPKKIQKIIIKEIKD